MCTYIYETCAWTPNNVFLLTTVVGSLSSKLAAGLRYFRLRYLGWQPAILISRLLAAGLRYLGLGT